MPDPFAAAIVCAVVLCLGTMLLHSHGPTVPWPEFYARPFYYGIGFGCFLAILSAWGSWVGPQTPLTAGTLVICALIIGGGEGIGMLTMYLWHNLRERHETQTVTAADPRTQGTHDTDPDA